MRDHGSRQVGPPVPQIVEEIKEKENKEDGDDTSIVPEGHTRQEDSSGS